ncbi:MAG: tRNA (adenosine(37)-N6)-threonylcarbamoyltransferase complex ATPase subunit type 1 TsaE [Ardenticatenaceae bacterium]
MSVLKGNTLGFFSYGPAQTRRFGARLGGLVQPGDVILLYGDLGAGKTHFAQGIAQGLGIEESVRSPTFTLINEYHEGRIPLYHVDLYRVDGDEDIATLGLEDYFDTDGVVVVEWPEKGENWMPADALHIHLEHIDERRRAFTMDASQRHSEALLTAFKKHVFAAPSG